MSLAIRGRGADRGLGGTERWDLDMSDLEIGKPGPKGFRGRPGLAARLAPGFQAIHKVGARSSAVVCRSRLFWLFRFLDRCEELSRSVSDIGHVVINNLEWHEVEALWPRFLSWLQEQPLKSVPQINAAIHAVLQASHEIELREGLTTKSTLLTYVAFQQRRDGSYGHDPINYEEGGRLFRTLAGCWRAALKVVEAGRSTASAGQDPRTGSSGKNRWVGSTWARLENRRWLVFNAMPFGILGGVEGSRVRDGFAAWSPGTTLASALRADTGLWAHVPALFLTADEIAVAFAMVCLKSGMSPVAVARMRVDGWYKDDPMHPGERVVIYGPKRIPGKILRASSSVRRLTDPYQVILKVIQLTEPLRRRALSIAALTGNAKLARAAKLIWIWPTGYGLAHALPGSKALDRMHGVLDALADSHGLKRDDGTQMRFRLSEARSIWAMFVYRRSGFNAVLTAKSLDHSNLRSLLHYIETREAKRLDRHRLIELQGGIVADFRNGRYDPASHRERPVAARSVMGLPCIAPTAPSPEADPGHRAGRICRKQRCWLCHQWFATVESLPYLVRIRLDLEAVSSGLALSLWETSDYPDMLAFCRHVTGKFHRDHVEAATRVAASMPPIVLAAPSAVSARTA